MNYAPFLLNVNCQMRAAIRSTRNTFLVSLVFSLPVVIVSMGFRSKAKGGLSEGE